MMKKVTNKMIEGKMIPPTVQTPFQPSIRPLGVNSFSSFPANYAPASHSINYETHKTSKSIPYLNYKPQKDLEVLEKLEKSVNLSALSPSKSPPKNQYTIFSH